MSERRKSSRADGNPENKIATEKGHGKREHFADRK